MATTVGWFTLDLESETLAGPAEYLDEQGMALLERVLAGKDILFNVTAAQSPDLETAILTRLQTDFAKWMGRQKVDPRMVN
jgi:hypothetical protein